MNRLLKDTAKINLFTSMFIFGTIGIFVRYIKLPSSVIALSRGLIGTIFLILVTLIRREQISFQDIKRNLGKLLISGSFLGANWILLFEAYRYTTVSTATLCYYMAPVFVIIISPILLHEKLTIKKIICVVCALLGMVFVSGVLHTKSSNAFQITGILFGLGAALLYAGVILTNKKIKNISSYDMTITQLAVATVVMLPYTLFTEHLSALVITKEMIGLLILVGILHTGITYVLYFSALKHIKAQTAAIFSYIDPIVAILLSALILREKMSCWNIIGAILVLASTFVSELNRKFSKRLSRNKI